MTWHRQLGPEIVNFKLLSLKISQVRFDSMLCLTLKPDLCLFSLFIIYPEFLFRAWSPLMVHDIRHADIPASFVLCIVHLVRQIDATVWTTYLMSHLSP